MSLDALFNVFPKSIKNIKKKYIHHNKIIEDRMEKEGKYNKAVYEMIKNPNHINFEYISKYKPKFRAIKGIYDQKELLLADELNFFRKSFYDFEKKNFKIKKIFKSYKDDRKNKNNFLEKYKIFKNRTENKYFNDREMLKELKAELEKNNIKVPNLDLNKNLFDKNLLLVKKENIGNFLSYKMGSQKGDNKAFNYIFKINKILSNEDNKNIQGFNLFDEEHEINNNCLEQEYLLFGKKDISKDKVLEPEKVVSKINETLNNLKEVDKFLNEEKKEEKDFFQKLDDGRSNKISDNDKNNICRQNFQRTFLKLPNKAMNKNFNSIDEERDKSFNKRTLNKSLTLMHSNIKLYKQMHNSRKSLFFNNINQNNFNSNKKDILLNKSDYNSMDKKDLVKIKKVYLNRNNSQKSLNSNTIDSRMSTIYPNTSYDKFFNKRKTNEKPKTLKMISRSKSLLSPKIDELENVYEKVKSLEDSSIYNDMMKNYLRKKNVRGNLSEFTIFDVFNNYHKMHHTIYREDFIKKNISLKRDVMMDLDTIDKLKHSSSTTNLQIKNIKVKMEKMMNKITFPIHEE